MADKRFTRSLQDFGGDTWWRWGLLVGGAIASTASWALLMAGVQSIPLYLGLGAGFVLLIAAMFWAYHDARVERDELREATEPRMDMVFFPDDPTYSEVLTDYVSEGPGQPAEGKVTRKFRVGVVNLSDKAIHGVHVLLLNCEPNRHNHVRLKHRLVLTGSDSFEGETILPVSINNEPSVFFDVVSEVSSSLRNADYFCFCYAHSQANRVVERPASQQDYSFTVTLRAQGAGRPVDRTFRIHKPWAADRHSGSFEHLRMEPL